MSEEKNLLEVSHLKQYFPVRKGCLLYTSPSPRD